MDGRQGNEMGTDFVDVIHHAVDDLTLEGLEHNGAVPCDELGLPAPAQDHTLPDIQDRDNRDDVAKLAGTGAFDVGIQFRLEKTQHAGSKVGWVKENCVG